MEIVTGTENQGGKNFRVRDPDFTKGLAGEGGAAAVSSFSAHYLLCTSSWISVFTVSD